MSPDAAAGGCVIGESLCNLDLSRRGPSPFSSAVKHLACISPPPPSSLSELLGRDDRHRSCEMTSAAFYEPRKMQREMFYDWPRAREMYARFLEKVLSVFQ